VIAAILLCALVLGAFLWSKATSDITIVIIANVSMELIYGREKWFPHNFEACRNAQESRRLLEIAK